MELNLDPPCCKLKACKFVFEDNPCCKSVGKVGLPYFHENRGFIMLTAAFLSFISLVFAIVPVVSTSLRNEDVKNTAWTYGESDDLKIWIGLKKVVYESNSGDGDFQWESNECSSVEDENPRSFCNDCKSSCLAAVSMVISNLITTLPNIKGNITRSTPQCDKNCEKSMALITGVVGTLTTLSALSVYADVCGRQLPDDIFLYSDIDYEIGPGYICLLIATLLKPVDVIINLLTPVPSQNVDSSTALSGDLQESLLENDGKKT